MNIEDNLQDITTYVDKLIELRLDISNPINKGKVYVFLEGESDVKLFKKLFNPENCKVENLQGAAKVEEFVQALSAIYPLTIGIRDADFIHLDGLPYSILNVFLTDVHDIEMMIFSEDELFNSLIIEHLPIDTNFSRTQHLDERDKILKSIKQIGLLKWLNAKENLAYNFHVKIGFRDLLSFIIPGVEFETYFNRVVGKSSNVQTADIVYVSERMNLLAETNPDLFQLCNGHDFLIAFSQYLRQVHNINGIDDKNIARICRTSYNFNHYRKSALYQNTKKWADDNNCVIY